MKYCIISFFIYLSGLIYAQGNVDGFFKQKGEVDLAFSGTFSASNKYFRKNDVIDYDRAQAIIGVYGAYGITNKWNVVLNLPLINFKPQDAAVFTKYHLVDVKRKKGDFTIAPALGVSFPLSHYATQSGQAIGQRATIVQPKVLFQYKHKANLFVQGQVGYNYTLDPVPSATVASIKAGYIYKDWYFDAWFDYQYGIGGTDYGVAGADFRELGVSYNKIGGVIYKSVGINSGVFLNGSYIFAGRNIGNAYTVGAGYVLKLQTNKKSNE
ncbi:MAG: hypothetical protein MK105_03875 [Crocinitomicaceae bacterium]|nr:hypothetical protein [Crocinitomicaceae bacterium]